MCDKISMTKWIYMYFVYPLHSTHKTQPLDKGVFCPLKQSWREECHSNVFQNPGRVVIRYSLSAVFNRAWMKSMTPLLEVSRPLTFTQLIAMQSFKEKQSLLYQLVTHQAFYNSSTWICYTLPPTYSFT